MYTSKMFIQSLIDVSCYLEAYDNLEQHNTCIS